MTPQDVIKKIKIIQEHIVAEWDTIKNYNETRNLFTDKEQKVLDDIMKEERNHIGQFQAMLEGLGVSVSSPISAGMKEGREQLGGK